MSKRVSVFLFFIISLLMFILVNPKSEATEAAIASGVGQFQIYINNNLPLKYLGSPLTVDGICNSSTKIAAVKLIQYKLNAVYELNIDVNGYFGAETQTAFNETKCFIDRTESGFWVFVLQGLLYCNKYNPKGFDGSYGVGGGTGCLNAVISFKTDKSIDEYPGTGKIGAETIASLCWSKYSLKKIEDGIYYIKNLKSNLYLQVEDGAYKDYTKVCQSDKTESLCQLWKVKHIENGNYSIRPLHKLNMGLDVSASNVGIYSIGLKDTLEDVPPYARWIIGCCDNGFLLRNCKYNYYLIERDKLHVVEATQTYDKEHLMWLFERIDATDIDCNNLVLDINDTVDILISDYFNPTLILLIYGYI